MLQLIDNQRVNLNMENNFYDTLISNILKIMRDRNLTQGTIAEYMGITSSQFTKVLKKQVKVSIGQLSNLAQNLSMSEIDIITYPDKFVKVQEAEQEPVEAVLQIKLKKDKKDQVLKLIFGENNIEILNK